VLGVAGAIGILLVKAGGNRMDRLTCTGATDVTAGGGCRQAMDESTPSPPADGSVPASARAWKNGANSPSLILTSSSP
jgi:hypothetical protein